MSQAAADVLNETCAADERWEPAMEFTYKSGQRPLEGYTVKRGLGWGGFGEVYFAISDGGKEVALKLVQRHLDVEMRGVAHCLNLKHPNLLAIYDIRNNEKGETWVVMEYMAGNSLRARLDQARGQLGVEETLDWLRGIAAAINHLHQHGIVHRDLKPGNVFRDNELVTVGDYGLSKFISASRRSGQTQSVGTVHYMAPEISTGNYDQGVDIYAMAVMAFEMLSGDVPFDGETTGEILMKHLTAEPEVEKIDRRYRPIFAKALAKDPTKRYANSIELYDAIRAAATGQAKPTDDQVGKARQKPAPRPVAGTRVQDLQASIPPLPGTLNAKRRSLSNQLWSMFLAGLLSSILPILALAAQLVMNEREPDLKSFVTMAVITGLTSCGILASAHIWDKHRVEASMRRLGMLLLGLFLGVGSLGLNVWLDHQVPASVSYPVGRVVWNETFWKDSAPAFLIYASLFGIAMAVPDWAQLACKLRSHRFSMWAGVVWPASVGTALAWMLHGPDPLWVGGIFAMTGIIVQWVSPYEDRRKRRRYAMR